MTLWTRVLSWRGWAGASAPTADPAKPVQWPIGETAGVRPPESIPKSTAARNGPVEAPADAAGAAGARVGHTDEQPQRRHHRADLRTPEQADAALQPHPDRATAAVHCLEAAKIVLSLDLEVEWLTAQAFLLQVGRPRQRV